MKRFAVVIEILRRYRAALYLGFACIVVTQAANVTVPELLKRAVDAIQQPEVPDLETVGTMALLLVGVAVLRGITQFFMRLLLVGASRRMEADLRQRVFEHLERLHFGWFDTARTGDILSRVTADVEAVRMPVGPGIMYLVNTAVVAPAALVLMYSMSPKLTLLVLAPLVLVSVVTRFLAPVMHRTGMEVQEGQADLASRAQESFAGVRVVKSYGREEEEIRSFREQGAAYASKVLAFVRVRSLMGPSFWVLEGGGMLLILWVGGGMVGRGEMTLGEFTAFYFYNFMLLWPMISLGWVIALFQRGAAAMDRINQVLATRPAIETAPDAVPLPAPRGEIEVRDLTFAYGSNPPVLHGISFRVPAGRSLAILGPTGSGKSTLLSILPRLFRVPDGTVFLDGVDVNRLRVDDLRRAIAVVPQETFLFSTTIRENLAWGFEEPPPDPVVEEAAEAARVAEEVRRFPRGFDTLLGERGVNLSGGQKQRVAIARAVSLDAPVLLLDDCLSAVDASTEEEILRNLRRVLHGRTTVIVSHRVAAVRHADEILFLEEGRVAERGSHGDLLALGGRYAGLARLQRLEGEIESVR